MVTVAAQATQLYFNTTIAEATFPSTDTVPTMVQWGVIFPSEPGTPPPDTTTPVELVSMSLTYATNINTATVDMIASDNGIPFGGAGPGVAGNTATVAFLTDDNVNGGPLHIVVNVEHSIPSPPGGENVTLNFAEFQSEYVPQKPDGSGDPAVSGGWGVASSVPISGFVFHAVQLDTDLLEFETDTELAFSNVVTDQLNRASFDMSFNLIVPPGITLGNGTPLFTITMTANAIPEPATISLLGLGLAGLGFARQRRSDRR